MDSSVYIKSVVANAADLDNMLTRLAQKINQHYADIKEPVICIGVLYGCLPFFSDLLKRLQFNTRAEFIVAASYDGKTKQSHKPIVSDSMLRLSLKGRHVLIIDDIVDTSQTIKLIKKALSAHQPASIQSVACVVKEHHEEALKEVTWWGIKAPDEFLFGYGLDYKDLYRYTNFIAVFNKAMLKK